MRLGCADIVVSASLASVVARRAPEIRGQSENALEEASFTRAFLFARYTASRYLLTASAVSGAVVLSKFGSYSPAGVRR